MYPALVGAEAMRTRLPEAEFAFVGSVGGFERPLVEASGLPLRAYHEVQAGPLAGVSPPRALNSLARLAWGGAQAFGILRQGRPQVVFSTGGWVSFPVALAAWLRRVPLVIYLPDIEPGATISVLKRFAAKVAVTLPESARYFAPGQTVVTGYPLRRALLGATREAGLAYFNLDPARKTLLVFGGSTGARSINIAVIDALPKLLARGDLQIIHVIGERDWERAEAQRAGLNFEGAHYHPFRYLHDEMGLALAAADLAINRAGASVLGELPYFGLPSILIPYPHAWRYQKVNADALAGRGAAIRLDDERLADDLAAAVAALLDDPARLEAMGVAARALTQADAAERLADLLIAVAQGAGRTTPVPSAQDAQDAHKEGRA